MSWRPRPSSPRQSPRSSPPRRSRPRRQVTSEAAAELAAEAIEADEIAVELAEEAVAAEAVAVELAEEAVVADAVAEELARGGRRRRGRRRRARRRGRRGRFRRRTDHLDRCRARSRSRSRVGSVRGRAPRWRRSARTAPRRCRATRSSITCSRPTSDVRAALVERFGERILGEDGAPDRAQDRRDRVRRRRGARVPRGAAAPARLARVPASGASSSRALDDPPAVCVTEVPLLYESGGETRFDRVVVITAPRQLREQRRQVPLDNRDDRLLDDAREGRAGPTSTTSTPAPSRISTRGSQASWRS